MVIMAYGLGAAAMILLPGKRGRRRGAPALLQFSVALLVAGAAMYLAGAGLKAFGEGLATFNDVEPESLVKAVVALGLFSLGLINIIPLLTPAMLLVGVGLLLFGAGLKSFAKGIAEFNKVGVEEMMIAATALTLFGVLLLYATVPMGVAALLLGIPLMMIGAGLQSFAKGIAEFNKVGIDDMIMAATALATFGVLLLYAVVPMGVAALLLGIPLMLISTALGLFAENLRKFRKVGVDDMLMAAASLVLFGILMIQASVPIIIGASLIAIPLAMLGLSLGQFAQGLAAFNKVGLDGVMTAVAALMAFGVAMFFMQPIIPVMAAAFYILSVPMMMFGTALALVGLGLLFIGESIPALFALTDALSVISMIGLTGTAAMAMLANSIMGIALALAFIPESKTMSFGFAMQGYAGALAAVAALTPDTTDLAERVVAAAGEYAEIQAEMKMPDQDSFVQAMKNVFGMGDKEDKGGQDIILQVNGREFARAVDVVINKKHNLRID